MVVWLVGLSGSGKTTIAHYLCDRWRKSEPNLVLVDGDEMRSFWGADRDVADYSVEARRRNAERMVECCLWLDRQNINVVCAILCMFDDILLANRERFSNYFQVDLQASVATLRKRDPKGLYARSERGDLGPVVGVDIPYSPPSRSDLSLCTEVGSPTAAELAERVLLAVGVRR